MKLDPKLKKRITNFKRIKRGYYSLIILTILIVLSLFLEFFVNNKALIVSYKGEWYFPVVSKAYQGTQFGREYSYETKYRHLQKSFQEENEGDWVMMPVIPFNAFESDFELDKSPPNAPSWDTRHLLGTDSSGRDVLARLLYGFRICIFFAFGIYLFTTCIGVFFGSLMGYFGGLFDLFFQRLVEIWSNIPSLYLIIIIGALMFPNLWVLMGILVFVHWVDMTTYIRAEMYREKSRQYAEAARSMGASHLRIIFKHLLPNSLVPIIAKMPFQMVWGINVLTSLDYLGYGLTPPTPSWGELMGQGQEAFSYAPWLLLSPTVAMIVVLILFTFIGEAVRESFDPKQYVMYE